LILASDGSDFGSNPHSPFALTATLTNNCLSTARLAADPVVRNTTSTVATSPSTAFRLGASFPPEGTLITPGGHLEIPIVFTPDSTRKFFGELDVSVDGPVQADLTLPLAGFGGGPVILCSPLGLDFGNNAVGITSTLSVLCTNIGQNVPGQPDANLFIGDPPTSVSGLALQKGDTPFNLAFDEPFPAEGLVAGKSTKINVTYAPWAGGTDSDTLVISSDDSVRPKTNISLVGTAKILPDCDFTLNPASGLAFGHVEVGSSAILPFQVVNNGTDECRLSDIQMSDTSDPAFTLVSYLSGNLDLQFVPGGSSRSFYVAFAPTSAKANFAAAVSFKISNDSRQHQQVSLSGSSLPGCLGIAPSPLDLGFVKYGQSPASSSSRTITFENLCDTEDININSIGVVDLTINGGRPSPQFTVTRDPSPVTSPKRCSNCPPKPIVAEVAFTPLYPGAQIAALKLYTSDLTDPYLVPLTGFSEP
jgi:hypothetical protein